MTPSLSRLIRWCKRHEAAIALAGVLIGAVATILGAVGTWAAVKSVQVSLIGLAWDRVRNSKGIETNQGQGEALMVLHNAGISLSQLDLPGTNLGAVDLRGATLYRSNFRKAAFPNARLDKVEAPKTDFCGAQFHQTSAREANFVGSAFSFAYIYEADFKKAKLINVDFNGAMMQGADLRGADLFKARNLTQTQLNMACVDETTNLKETGLIVKYQCRDGVREVDDEQMEEERKAFLAFTQIYEDEVLPCGETEPKTPLKEFGERVSKIWWEREHKK